MRLNIAAHSTISCYEELVHACSLTVMKLTSDIIRGYSMEI